MTHLTIPLDLNILFKIAESSDLFDRLEAELRASGHESAANDLMKLQQDAGLEIDREMTGDDWSDPAPGPETAALRAAYQSTSVERFTQVVGNAIALVPGFSDAQQITGKFALPPSSGQIQNLIYKPSEPK